MAGCGTQRGRGLPSRSHSTARLVGTARGWRFQRRSLERPLSALPTSVRWAARRYDLSPSILLGRSRQRVTDAEVLWIPVSRLLGPPVGTVTLVPTITFLFVDQVESTRFL